MIRYVAVKGATALLALFVLTIVVFAMVRVLPGSVEDVLLGLDRSPQAAEAIRRRYDLDQPLVVQYAKWAGGLLKGDFGVSLRTQQPISQTLVDRGRPTVELALSAMALSLVAGIGLGLIGGLRSGSRRDRIVSAISLLGLSVPDFVIGLGLVTLVSGRLELLPGFGYEPMSDGLAEWARHLILPTIALSLTLIGALARLTRRSVVEGLSKDYVRTAVGKGMRWRTISLRHVLRPSLGPVVSTAGVQFVSILGGVVVIEYTFSIPGFGSMIIDGLRGRDYPVLQAAILLSGVFAVVINFLVDLINRLNDPRVRH